MATFIKNITKTASAVKGALEIPKLKEEREKLKTELEAVVLELTDLKKLVPLSMQLPMLKHQLLQWRTDLFPQVKSVGDLSEQAVTAENSLTKLYIDIEHHVAKSSADITAAETRIDELQKEIEAVNKRLTSLRGVKKENSV